MPASPQVLGIVWAETKRLRPTDGADATKSRLQAVVGGLAAQAEHQGSTAGFIAPQVLPPVGSPGGEVAARMATTVSDAIAASQWAGVALPRRAVLWETTATGEPRVAERPLPPAAAWVRDGVAARTATFNIDGDTTHRVFTLFESDAEPRLGDPVYVSALTGSGAPVAPTRHHPLTVPWVVGIAATVLFFWMLTSLAWTGHSVSQARDLLAGTLPGAATGYLQRLDAGCHANGSLICQNAFTAGATPPDTAKAASATAACVKAPGANEVAALHTSPFCQFAWATALDTAASGTLTGVPRWLGRAVLRVIGWPVTVSARTGALSLAFPMALLVGSIALLGVALGLGTQGRAFGIWVGPENRFSLARMQVSLWTLVVLGAYAAIAVFNAGMIAAAIRTAQTGGAEAKLDGLVAFPTMPSMILAALGIAAASPMLSALIKGDVGKPAADIPIDLANGVMAPDAGGVGRFIDKVKGDGSGLEVRATPAEASLADLFLGETQSNKDMVDVSRLQNVVITCILVFGYGTLLLELVRDIAPEAIVGALNGVRPLFSTLPNPGATFTALLAASHGTYLVAKAATK